jgi:hypothetical protein
LLEKGTSVKSVLIRITLFSLIFILFVTNQSQAAPEQRTALVIGNSAYSSGPLKNPVNDAFSGSSGVLLDLFL